MDHDIELSRRLALRSGPPMVLVLVREELEAQSAAPKEREHDESSGPAAS
jgi:hypothetical protein